MAISNIPTLVLSMKLLNYGHLLLQQETLDVLTIAMICSNLASL